MTPRRKIVAGVLFAFSVVLVACVYLYFSDTFLPKQKLVVSVPRQPSSALVYLAKGNGYFAKEGLDVTFREFEVGRDALDDMIAGNSSLAVVYETPWARKVLDGQKLGVMAAIHSSTHSTAIIARKDKGVREPKDLWGRRIGYSKGTNADYFLSQYLISEGIRLQDVRRVPLAPNALERALLDGTVDAISTWNVPLYMMKEGISSRATVFYSPTYTEMSILTGKAEYLAGDPEPVRRFARALARAEDSYESDPEAAASIIQREMPNYTLEEVSTVLASLDIGLRLDNVLLAVLELETKWYKDNGQYKGDLPDLTKHIFPDFLSEIDPNKVTIF